MSETNLSRYESLPKKAKVDTGDAWWYANRGGIEIHIQGKDTHFTVTIPFNKLKDYVARMEK